MIDAKAHPIKLLKIFISLAGNDSIFEFGKYIYKPGEFQNKRHVYEVKASEAEEWFTSMISQLKDDEELAFQSKVKTKDNKIYHIPMIDFLSKIKKSDIQSVETVFKEFGISNFEIYETGRSYHLYGLSLISAEKFQEYMGALLLINPPDSPYPVDARWVGHQLINGYTALRWTHNSSLYKKYPHKISISDLD
ncbi:MAG TPA: hypothetical protein VIG33_16205 [Pseudobdellovibrionaceae bacterium]